MARAMIVRKGLSKTRAPSDKEASKKRFPAREYQESMGIYQLAAGFRFSSTQSMKIFSIESIPTFMDILVR